MELNLMIIGAFVILMIVGGLWVTLLEKIEEKTKRRRVKDIWYLV